MGAAKPAHLKLLTGRGDGKDAAGRPVNTGPGFRREVPEPPVWLDGEALAEWHRVVPELARLELLKPEDTAALVVYCEAWAEFVDATAVIAREGMFIEAKQGMLRHPAVAIRGEAAKRLVQVGQMFGLTPVAEQKLHRGGGDGDDDNPF